MARSSFELSLRRALLASAASFVTFSAAQAQEAPAPTPPVATQAAPSDTPPDEAGATATQDAGEPSTVAEVVVTGSRLNVSGYRQPTPVTVVGLEKLETDNQTDLSSVITSLPAVASSPSPNSSNGQQNISNGTGGLSLVNLRGLGTGRTLTLFDGRRVAPSIVDGGTDLNLLPTGLVERIDVVTGGASAAWGSDAVAGVVNVILNKRFEGWKVNLEGATDQEGLRESTKAEVSFGTPLFGGRGHLIVSGSMLDSPDLILAHQLPWYKSQALVNNPSATATNDEPRLIHAENVGFSTVTRGGLISTGPLRGTQFLENGLPAPFDFGRVSGPLSVGGTYAGAPENGQSTALTAPIESRQLFGFFSYDLTDEIKLSAELNWGETKTQNSHTTYIRSNNLTIQGDNAFIHPDLLARMRLLGVTSFNIGTTNTNNYTLGDSTLGARTVGKWNNDVERILNRQVLSITGPLRLFGEWDWNVDLQHSKIDRNTRIVTNPLVARYNQAVDAVRVTAANVGSSGLALGSIACRSTLAAPTNGCVPLNVLGINVADPAAIAWVNGGNALSTLALEQYTASAAMRGEPFSLPAGPVSVAFGVDYRWESNIQEVDPLAIARAYSVGNPQPFDANQYSIEGFGEVNVPLLRDWLVQSLDFNAAGRLIDYSSVGQVFAWKMGLVSTVTDDVRLRGTVSRDIRAPGLYALYDTGSSTVQVVGDPLNGNTPTNIISLISGNPDLTPEEATSYTAGVVYSPSFIPGLNASLDWYSIKIDDAFVTPTAAIILEQCSAGNQQYCALVVRNGAGVLTNILRRPINAASQEAAGIDFQMDYRRPLWDGNLGVSFTANQILTAKTDSLGTIIESPDGDFRATLATTWSRDRFSGTVQLRSIGEAKVRSEYGPRDIDDNTVPAVTYLDLRASYRVGADENVQIYVAADNVLDEDPPIIPNGPTDVDPLAYPPTRTAIYDFLGREFRFGVRMTF